MFSRYFYCSGFQRGRLQFKRFLIVWEINNCVMFVSFCRMLSVPWSFPADYSNYACDFTRLPKARCVLQFEQVRMLTWAIKRSNHMMVDSSVYTVLTHKHRSGFVGFAYLLSRTKTAIAIYFIALGIFVRGWKILWNCVLKTIYSRAIRRKRLQRQKCLNGFPSHCSWSIWMGFIVWFDKTRCTLQRLFLKAKLCDHYLNFS